MSPISRNALALSALSALAAAQGTTAPKLDAPCADVVLFMARGNDAPYQDSRTFPFVEATCGKLRAEGKTCDFIEIEYDVTYGGDYCAQIAEGARNGISQITAFNAKCPCTHIVVNGYSQGGHVVGDVLGGPGGCTFVSSGLDSESSAGQAIAAALLWGDVMHTANQPYNVLDGADKGPNPRSPDDLARLNRYAPVLRSYCAAGDPVCAGGSVVADHLNYFELYTDEASSWVVSKLANTAPLCVEPTPTPSPSASASATPSPSASDVSSVAPPASSSAAPSAASSYGSGYGTAAPPAASSSAPGYGASPPPAASSSAPGYGGDAPGYGGDAPSSSKATPTKAYPTSAVTPSPFPEPHPYEPECVAKVHVEYVYV